MSDKVLDDDRLRKVVAAARLLESDKPGDVQAGLAGMRRLLEPVGLTIAEFLQSHPASPDTPTPRARPVPRGFEHILMRDHQRKASWLTRHVEALNERERQFLRDMATQRAAPSPAQREWLDRLFIRNRKGVAND